VKNAKYWKREILRTLCFFDSCSETFLLSNINLEWTVVENAQLLLKIYIHYNKLM